MNQRKAGALLSYVSLVVRNGVSLLFLPYMVRMLGQSQYGLYQLVGSLAAYLSVLDFGLSTTVARYVARHRAHGDEEGQQSFISLILVIYALLAALVVAAGLLAYRVLPSLFRASLTPSEIGQARTMWLLVTTSAAVTVLTNGFRGICTAYERFVFLRTQDIIHSLLRVAALLVLLSAGYGAVAIVVTDLVLNVLFAGVRVGYTFLGLRIRLVFHSIQWSLFGEVLAFAFYVFLNAIVDQLYWKTGNIVLGALTSTGVVAVYSIGVQISMLFIALSTAISSVLLPQTVSAVERQASGAQLTDLMIRYGRIELLVLGLVLVGFASFGQEFIRLWVGPGYEMSYWVAVITMAPLLVPLVQNVGISILQAKNRHRFRSLMYLALALFNVGLSFVLVRLQGVLGAAWAPAIGLTLGNVIIINLYYHHKIGLQIPRFFRELARGTVPVLLLMMPIGFAMNRIWPNVTWIGLLLKAASFTVIYALGMWFIGANPYEQGLVRGVIHSGRRHAALYRRA